MTLNDRLEAYLRAHPNEWIPATSFEPIGGRQGWRTRLSNLRRKRGMTIKWDPRTVRLTTGEMYKRSGYVYVAAQQESQV